MLTEQSNYGSAAAPGSRISGTYEREFKPSYDNYAHETCIFNSDGTIRYEVTFSPKKEGGYFYYKLNGIMTYEDIGNGEYIINYNADTMDFFGFDNGRVLDKSDRSFKATCSLFLTKFKYGIKFTDNSKTEFKVDEDYSLSQHTNFKKTK